MSLLNKYLGASKLIIVYLLLFSKISHSQNLILNGSFEQYTLPIDCNGGGFEIPGSPTFHHVLNNWYAFNSPDYFNAICNSSSSWYNVPDNFFGKNYAKHGVAYTGIYIYKKSSEMKEYIYQQLSVQLKADTVYCLSIYTNRADRMPYAVKNLGAYFSNSLPSINYYITATPQVINQTGFLVDTTSWAEIKGCFTALGGEQFITIGNFNSNANTDTIGITSANPLTGTGTDVAYYFIDSVSLWQNNFPTKINKAYKDFDISVYPNPARDIFNIEVSNMNLKDALIVVSNYMGQSVYTSSYHSQIDLSGLPAGMYFLTINNKSLKQTIKIIKINP